MAYDEGLAERIRKIVRRKKGMSERKMFGGIAFMANNNMACGIHDRDLMVRIGDDAAATALADEPHTRPMDITGRPMKSYVTVSPAGLVDDDALRDWVDRGIAYARSLPPK